MADTQQSQSQDGSLGRDVLYALRNYVGSRRGLFALAGLAIAAGLAFNWSWLAAAGIAPILISVLPCVAMCALGLCMNRMTGRACAPDRSQTTTAPEEDEQSPGLAPDELSADMRPAAKPSKTQIGG